MPPSDAEFGVISDIDDTIIYSNVTRKLRMMVTLALSNAHTRKPFWGVAAFYRALHRGRNPFFYVSKSPWNLYVPLLEFLQRQQLPAGPLLLARFWPGYEERSQGQGDRGHSRHLSRRFRFILIGDSGEEDPEIYAPSSVVFPTASASSIFARSTVTHTAEGDREASRESRVHGMPTCARPGQRVRSSTCGGRRTHTCHRTRPSAHRQDDRPFCDENLG